ncbi:MAG: hypothetical protein C4523_13260, partial [Myxococcales bacterium]
KASCLDCHGDPDLKPLSKDRKPESIHIAKTALKGSVHEDLDCTDCHANDESAVKPHHEGGPTPALLCGGCHDKAMADYNASDIHGKRYNAKDPDAPWCQDCHGGHQIVPLASKDSAMSRVNQPETCGKCHGANGFDPNVHVGIAKRRLIERYYSSAHWAGIQNGKPSATCSDCHGHHTVLPSSDFNSTVARSENLPNTCRKCHPNETSAYLEGSHGRTLQMGNLDVPTCTTCHGDHDIMSLRIQASGRRDYAATQVCIWCHGNERMMSRYALDTSPVEHYMSDYHGLSQRGSLGASATCADCHDAHHSLPESHPRSRMHLSNRGTTCGKCHGQSNESFIASFSHKAAKGRAEERSTVVHWITVIYIVLIVGTIGGMFLHNLVVWLYYTRRKLRYQTANPKIVRLNKLERLWHWVLLISFIVLAVTGFMLSFSESDAFKWIYSLGFTENVRAWLHHTLGVVLVLDLLGILLYGLASQWGRRWWVEMLPGWDDVRDFFKAMRHYLLLTPEHVRHPVFNYAEKAEWWALLWGTAIMALTGVIMWFPELLPANAPNWVIAAAKAIHFYEALLACLAVIVWHFFHVIYHPVEMPMNTAWLSGVLTDDEAHERFTPEAIAKQIPPERPTPKQEPPLDKKWLKATDPESPSEKPEPPVSK